jgi:hypothetical protein
MLQYRASDKLIAAATHGRGIWTQSILSVLPINNFTLRGKWSNSISTELVWNFEESSAGGNFTAEFSFDGLSFSPAGTLAVTPAGNSYTFGHQPGRPTVFYRIKHVSNTGKVLYSNVVRLVRGSNESGFQITKLFPNPVQSELKVAFVATGRGKTTYTITNLSGQVVWRKEEDIAYTGNYIKTWDIQTISKGSYVFTISNGNQKVSEKFIKQ